jgi:hypothetical protein
VIGSLGAAASAAEAPRGAWRELFNVRVPAAQTLRGFGRVETEFTGYEQGQRRVGVQTFRCESAEKAGVLIGKFLADVALSAGVVAGEIQSGGQRIPALTTREGTVFVGCREGAEARILDAPSREALLAFAATRPELLSGALSSAAYPVYLDYLDRWGWGLCGLGGLENTHGWMETAAKFDGKPGLKDPLEDVDFLAQYKFRYSGWFSPVQFDCSDGITGNVGTPWKFSEAAKRGLPMFFSYSYGATGGANWMSRRFGPYMEQPADFLQGGFYNPQLFFKAQPQLSWHSRDAQGYVAANFMAMMRQYADQPTTLGYMEPHGELSPEPWYFMHADYSSFAQESWRAYLQKRGLDLPTLSRMYGRPEYPLADWEEVPVPEFATFAGLPGRVAALEGEWFYRRENGSPTPADAAWWSQPAEQRYQGLREQWWNAPLDMTQWSPLHAPGSDMLYGVFPAANPDEATTWFRRSFTLTAQQVQRQPLYLYWFPISHEQQIHSGEHRRYHDVYLNGKKAGEIGSWGALDVTNLVRAGENQIALHLMGSLWSGRIFLSTEPPQVFPYLGKERNQLWMIWKEWLMDSRHDAVAEVLDGMRQVDPNRMIRLAAPIGWGTDRWLDLAVRYGGYGHFTGEGMWYFPWYKRYGFLYGVPGSSELGGPLQTTNDQFDAARRVFLAGLNTHEEVFNAQTYTRNPVLRQWWVDHNSVLKRLGTYDIDGQGPQVLLYRSTGFQALYATDPPYPTLGQASRELQTPWMWDLGRGTLQTIGQSCLYLDDGGIKDGKMYGYRLMMDAGNETISEQAVADIAAWVRAGGTFITLPFTGRNSLVEPDSWPIRALTGCEIGTLRTPGAAGATVTIGKQQSVFHALAGQTFPDAGRAEYLKINHNLLSVELKPGPGDEVLATFENGAPAIVKHKLGKGTVIVLGSAFWRDSADTKGLWPAGAGECAFVTDLLAGVGFDPAPCTTDDPQVWPQPYRSNNGLDAVTVLVSWHEDKDVVVRTSLRLAKKPAQVTVYGVEGIQNLRFEWKDGVATLSVPMPAQEIKVIAAESFSPDNAVAHWWSYQEQMWRQLDKPVVDFTPYTQGEWKDPTLDLYDGARFTNTDPGEAKWTEPAFDDSAWKPGHLDVLNFDGAAAGQPAWVRRSFEVPAEWLNQGGDIYLVSGMWSGPHYLSKARMYLNGTLLHDYTTGGYSEFVVTPALLKGRNVVAFQFQGGPQYVGIQGNVFLYHRVPPERSVALSGQWDGLDQDGKLAALTLPGKGAAHAPTRMVAIPEQWRGRYRVRLCLDGARESVLGAWVNGRLVRRHHHGFGGRCDIDITDMLKFGAENEITLANQGEANAPLPRTGPPPTWEISSVRLELFPSSPNRP